MAIPALAPLIAPAFLAAWQISYEIDKTAKFTEMASSSSTDLNGQIENVQKQISIINRLNENAKTVLGLNLGFICASVISITLLTALSPTILIALKISILVSATQAFINHFGLIKKHDKLIDHLKTEMFSLFQERIGEISTNYREIMEKDKKDYPDRALLQDTDNVGRRIDYILTALVFNTEEMNKVYRLYVNTVATERAQPPNWEMANSQNPLRLIIEKAALIRAVYGIRKKFNTGVQELQKQLDEHEKPMLSAFEHIRDLNP